MINDSGFPVQGDITSIDQIERIQAYVDDKILDSLDWIAGKFDRFQQAITLATGSILKNVGTALKKEIAKTGRVVSKIQKSLDYANFQDVVNSSVDTNVIDEVLDNAPMDVVDIDGGFIPVKPNDPSVPDNPPSPCNMGDSRVNPDTCELELCSEGGVWLGNGQYSQACLDAKNPPPPPPPNDGNGGGGLGNTRCLWFDSSTIPSGGSVIWANNQTIVCGGHLDTDTTISLSGNMQQTIRDFFGYNKPFIKSDWQDTYRVNMNGSPTGNESPNEVQTVINIPYQMYADDKLSPYTEAGQVSFINRYNRNPMMNPMESSTPLNELVNNYFYPNDPISQQIEVEIASDFLPVNP